MDVISHPSSSSHVSSGHVRVCNGHSSVSLVLALSRVSCGSASGYLLLSSFLPYIISPLSVRFSTDVLSFQSCSFWAFTTRLKVLSVPSLLSGIPLLSVFTTRDALFSYFFTHQFSLNGKHISFRGIC